MSLLSRRYATAFVETAVAAKTLDTAARELEAFARAFELKDVAVALTNPGYPLEQRLAMQKAVLVKLGASELTQRFLALVAERDRLAEVGGIARAVRQMADERAGRVRAKVESATALAADAQSNLKRALEKRTGKKVDLDVVVDPELLGGLRATIGSTVFDGTLRSQLARLSESLERAD